MCELLLFAGNRSDPDPVRDRGCLKLGMAIMVEEDGWQWQGGDLEAGVVVKIPGVSASRARGFLDPQVEDDTGAPYYETIPEANPKRGIYRIKAWRVKVADIPAAIRNQLLTDRQITVTVAQIRNYLRRIRDDAQFTGID